MDIISSTVHLWSHKDFRAPLYLNFDQILPEYNHFEAAKSECIELYNVEFIIFGSSA
jgi:hypothetical protein